MSEFEKISNEKLNELGNEVVENMNDVKPIEIPSDLDDIEKPEIEEIKNKPNISLSNGYCICSCTLTCTRA